MWMMKRCVALLLALCLVCSLAACGSKADDTLHARYAVLYRTDFLQDYLDDPEANAEQIASFGADDFAGTFADPDAFHCYNAEIAVGNDNDFAVSLLAVHVEPKNVGKGGVYLSTLGDGVTVGLPAHFSGDNAMYYQVIADASLSDEEVLQALSAQNAVIQYVDSVSGADTLEEAAEAQAEIMQSVISYGA